MTIKITLDNWSVQKESARGVRMEVFVIEQKIPKELEWDDMDEHCIHAVATNASGTAVGTGRLLPDGHIGRMAVLSIARGLGVGGLLLQGLMTAARERGDKQVALSAQISAREFYTRFGFQVVGDEYIEAGIPHINMEYVFP
jgi:predicted GNAT family N-acyltransferase